MPKTKLLTCLMIFDILYPARITTTVVLYLFMILNHQPETFLLKFSTNCEVSTPGITLFQEIVSDGITSTPQRLKKAPSGGSHYKI